MGYNRKTQDKFIVSGIWDKFSGWIILEEFDNLSQARNVKSEYVKNDPSGNFKITRNRFKVDPLTESKEEVIITLYNLQ